MIGYICRTKFLDARKREIQVANRASTIYLGALDMLSMPPATTTSLIPSSMLCAANIVAVMQKSKYVTHETFLPNLLIQAGQIFTFHSGCTDFVYSGADNCIWYPSTQSSLPSGSLTQICTQDIAKKDFLHQGWINACPSKSI